MNRVDQLLILTQLFYPEMISTGQTMTELGEELTRLGMNIKVVCGPPTLLEEKSRPEKTMIYNKIQIHRVWGTRFPKLKSWGRMLNQFTFAASAFSYLLRHDRSLPVLVNTNPPFLALICSALRKLQGRTYIYLVLDIYPDTISTAGLISKTGFISRLWKSANRVMFKNASRIIPIGRHMRHILAEEYPSSTANKLTLIPIWSDDRLLSMAPDVPNPFQDKWGTAGRFVVLYAGNMGRFHDLKTILDAATRLQNQPEILFIFVGEGYQKAEMQALVKSRSLDNCRFHSYVERSELKNLYACADVGLVTLQAGQEGLSVPSKTFGYLAAGLPILAVLSDKSEIAHIVREFNCGQVITPGDEAGLAEAIQLICEDQARLSRWGQNARAAIEKSYHLAAAAEAFQQVIVALDKPCRKN
jgi:glycosyltransferase involved in cell wall biosynthesis